MENQNNSFRPDYALNGDNDNRRAFPSVKSTGIFMLAVFGSYFLVQIVLVTILQLCGLTEMYNNNASFYYMFNAVYELIYLGVPLLIMVLYYNKDNTYLLRLKPMSTSELIITVVLGLFVFGTNLFLTEINVILASFVSNIVIPETPAVISVSDKLIFMLTLVVVAPVTEELIMRGVMMRGLEGRSKWFAIIVTGVFFGMLHLSYYTVFAKILVGILLCYIVYVTGSIYSGIIVHMINNGISGLITIMSETAEASEGVAAEMTSAELILMLMVYCFIAIFAVAAVLALVKALQIASRRTVNESNSNYKSTIREKLPSEEHIRWYTYIPMAITFILMAVIMIADCVA